MDRINFIKDCQDVLNLNEVQEAIKIVTEWDKYHTKFIDVILSENKEKIYENQILEKKKNRKKNLIKKFLMQGS